MSSSQRLSQHIRLNHIVDDVSALCLLLSLTWSLYLFGLRGLDWALRLFSLMLGLLRSDPALCNIGWLFTDGAHLLLDVLKELTIDLRRKIL